MSERNTTTEDVGVAIHDALLLLQEGVFPIQGGEPDGILSIDSFDPNNLVLHMGSGMQFTICVVRIG
jgi:hypothetical protein